MPKNDSYYSLRFNESNVRLRNAHLLKVQDDFLRSLLSVWELILLIPPDRLIIFRNRFGFMIEKTIKERLRSMMARIRKITSLFFRSNARSIIGYPQQKISSAMQIFYSDVSPIYRFEMDHSKFMRFRPFE